ncbi:hypothetical protein AB833_04930 [Chromatiales bacterium (ex Bugula neritina AB1)]|nr:hypothetical protein AB833_04930 [Chromatiales bacterium (ex Bugula neritina AB1)]
MLDNGGTRIRIGHIRSGVLCEEFAIHSSQLLCVPNAREVLVELIRNYAQQYDLNLKAAILGIPALLDRENDIISHCNNIPQLQGRGLRAFLAEELHCDVLLEQDIMLQLLGEWKAGAARQQNSVFGVYFGTGIGAAYLLNGDPVNPLVQDIQAGHFPIMAEGKICKCGNTDCVEAYASGHTLTGLAVQAACPVEKLFEYRFEDRWKARLHDELSQFILYQAYVLATVCTMFNPGLLIVGGGIPLMAGYPRDELIEKTRNHLQKPHPATTLKISWASLPGIAPLHGALALLERHAGNSSSITQVNRLS